MSKFEREHRYYVIKVKYLSDKQEESLHRFLREKRIPLVEECVVVESAWPMYEPTWQAIQEYVEGARQPSQIEVDRDIKAANLQLLVEKVMDVEKEWWEKEWCGETALWGGVRPLFELARSLKQ